MRVYMNKHECEYIIKMLCFSDPSLQDAKIHDTLLDKLDECLDKQTYIPKKEKKE